MQELGAGRVENINKEKVLEALSQVMDPDLGKDVVSLGMIRDVAIEGNDVSFRFVLTTPACPVRDQLEGQAKEAEQKRRAKV